MKPFRCRIGWHRWPIIVPSVNDGDQRTCCGCGLVQTATVDPLFNDVRWERVPENEREITDEDTP